MNDTKVKRDIKVVTTLSSELHEYVKTIAKDVEGNMSYAVRKIIQQHRALSRKG